MPSCGMVTTASTIADGKKKRRGKSYAIYIYKALKQVHPDTGISSKAMGIVNSLVNDSASPRNLLALPTTTRNRPPVFARTRLPSGCFCPVNWLNTPSAKESSPCKNNSKFPDSLHVSVLNSNVKPFISILVIAIDKISRLLQSIGFSKSLESRFQLCGCDISIMVLVSFPKVIEFLVSLCNENKLLVNMVRKPRPQNYS
ncbi:hypothetical protein pdam_00017694 [Pocillopora damicornis]|uniref:Histone H2A/H2B/H3 domain-containing protein n=1 Tax=Pocillopora damicornis TaxID=46731 RepID=A0A3M6TXP9_POCDA|nr:hypothetical protein pdam_00017694 [Pocillopora damicornis]